MPSGRKPIPTALKLVLGNKGKRALHQEREAKPKSARPNPPAFLCTQAKAEWRRRIDQLFNVGLMTEIDVAAFAAYCQSFGVWERAERALSKQAKDDKVNFALTVTTGTGSVVQNPLRGVANKAMADCHRYALEFGMSPAARVKVVPVYTPKPADNAPKKAASAEFFSS